MKNGSLIVNAWLHNRCFKNEKLAIVLVFLYPKTAKYTHEGEEGADRVEGLGGDE